MICPEFFDGEAETLGRGLGDLIAGEELDRESITPDVRVLSGDATDIWVIGV